MQNPNTRTFYDEYWGGEGCRAYLADGQLDEIAREIVERIGEQKLQVILDLGGGISRLARLARDAGHVPYVLDLSAVAVQQMRAEGIAAGLYDIRRWKGRLLHGCVDVVTCTEVLEHLSRPGQAVQMAAAHAPRAFFTAPNDCMGPAECPTHVRVYTYESLGEELRRWWREVRIEVRHRWLVAECRY